MATKIVATIGPSSWDEDILTQLVRNGVNIVRVNFSHATYEGYANIKTIVERVDPTVKMLFDLQGPRIRVGIMPEEGKEIVEGEEYVFTHNDTKFYNQIKIDDPYLHADVQEGEPLFLANGVIELKITSVKDGNITATAVRGGTLFSRKGINIPQTHYSRGALTEKDLKDIEFAITQNPEYIALSFVQTAADVYKLRELIAGTNIKIISKIETAFALKNIDEIIQVSDAIMIGRGDLGIEVPEEDLPIIQKDLIRHARWHNTPCIVATQMLLSMMHHPHPTRAEVSDVATAVFDGADAVMLSDETASGEYPIEAVTTMKRIITRIDDYHAQENNFDSI